ncbi:type I-F CRISPR-associated endoribonuclease Cas6/Csy4 [Endozoicomonas sp. ALB115]|uniref:type I-F CRISPR-associated endoribonuclease Cas6/Csy4 n=1 Tax=Endozoicomonas sp. ALB115 TaxID=3403074 RepID=UPI003BB63968
MNHLLFKIITEDADPQFLLSYILQESHPVIAHYGNNQIGTLFPEWNVDDPGRSIAFYGDSTVLNKIMEREYFRDMLDGEILESKLLEVDPENAQKAIFLRNQRITSNSPKGQQRKVKRIIRRQIDRGEISSPAEYKPRSDQHQTEVQDIFFHLFFPDSMSTGQNMPLCIQMVPVDESEELEGLQTFDHYGFSTLQEHRASVPLIKPIF